MILRNQAECLKCKGRIKSASRWDANGCQCGDIFVAGGTETLKRGGKDPLALNELSIITEKEYSREDADIMLAALEAVCAHPGSSLRRIFSSRIHYISIVELALILDDLRLENLLSLDPDGRYWPLVELV